MLLSTSRQRVLHPSSVQWSSCAESETCVLKGFLQWGQSCVSSSPSTSCSFLRRNLESSLPWFFFFPPPYFSLEKGFVVLESVNPHFPIYCQHPGGMNQPDLLRGMCKWNFLWKRKVFSSTDKSRWQSRLYLPASPEWFEPLALGWLWSSRLLLNFGLV